jgi:hypothetical protein
MRTLRSLFLLAVLTLALSPWFWAIAVAGDSLKGGGF